MKTSELIAQLQKILELHGDKNILLSVIDYYSKYGSSATIELNVDTWTGFHTDEENTTITARLEHAGGKKPKILFRG